jgi:hypothetical protein
VCSTRLTLDATAPTGYSPLAHWHAQPGLDQADPPLNLSDRLVQTLIMFCRFTGMSKRSSPRYDVFSGRFQSISTRFFLGYPESCLTLCSIAVQEEPEKGSFHYFRHFFLKLGNTSMTHMLHAGCTWGPLWTRRRDSTECTASVRCTTSTGLGSTRSEMKIKNVLFFCNFHGTSFFSSRKLFVK